MSEYFIKLWEAHSVFLITLGYKLLLVLVVLLACYFISSAASRFIRKITHNAGELDITLIPAFDTVIRLTVYLIGLLIVLDIFGVNTASILTILGAAGLAVALALKDMLSNLAAGVVLLVLRPFRVGHFIEFGQHNGTVKEINLLTTILETPDALYVSSPNSNIWNVPIKNYTRNGKRRLDLIVSISYSDSIDEGFNVLKEIINQESRFLSDPAPQVMVHAMADSSINLQLRAWLSVDDYWPTYWELNRTVKEKIEAANLTIPFPQRDIYIHQKE